MEKIIDSELFGKIKLNEDGFTDDIVDRISGRVLMLDIFEDVTSEKNLLDIKAILDNYIELDKQAKKYVLNALNQGEGTVQYYYEYHKDELFPELIERFGGNEYSDETLVSHTALANIWFSLDEGDVLATFDYKLLPEDSDEILAVRFDHFQKIIGVAHES